MAVQNSLDCLAVALGHGANVFRSAGSALNLEHLHTCLYHTVHEPDGLEVLGRHNVLVLDGQFYIGFAILDNVSAAAYLHAGSTVGAGVHLVKAQVALAAYSHAQGTVAEHLNTNQLTLGATHILLQYLTVNLGHLIQVKLTCQYHYIGKPGIELESLYVAYVELSGEMHLHTYLVAVGHHRDITCNNGRNPRFHRSIHDLMNQRNILAVHDCVKRKIALYAMRITLAGNLAQVIERKVAGTA